MSKNDIIGDVLSGAQNRRSLLKKLGTASAALGAAAAVGSFDLKADPATPTAIDVLQFALNLEYLEAEFYSVAVNGKTLAQQGYNFGPALTTTKYGKVNFANSSILTGQVAADIANDELQHVLLLRGALGNTAVNKPAINLDALDSLGASLKNELTFLLLSRIFEDIGVTAYAGGSTYLAGTPYLLTAARILATEAEHAANIRLQIARLGIPTAPALDGADVLPPPSGTNFFSTNTANGLVAYRTPGQVLHLAYGVGLGGTVTGGAFFPNGVNGNLHTADANAAPASNLS